MFCCFIGFDYSTTASLTEQNLVLADDGSMWIETHRVKTGVASKVKLLDIPLSILKKYEPTRIIGYNTCQVAKYDNYELGSFSEEAKHAWRDAHWEEDLQRAYDAGRKMAEQ